MTTHTYDGNGNVLTRSVVVNGQALTWSYSYNGFGEVLTATDPLGHTTTNVYDVKGNLTSSPCRRPQPRARKRPPAEPGVAPSPAWDLGLAPTKRISCDVSLIA